MRVGLGRARFASYLCVRDCWRGKGQKYMMLSAKLLDTFSKECVNRESVFESGFCKSNLVNSICVASCVEFDGLNLVPPR